MFLTLDQAAKRIARQTINPESTADSLKQLAEAGTLKICFRYRGTLGVFKFPATTLPPTPETSIYFDGYLKSTAKPRLHSIVKSMNTSQVIDQLTPKAVEIASYVFPDHVIDIQPPDYWGRVRDKISHGGKVQPTMMESCPIPESEWLIDEADLDIYFRSLTPVSAVSAPQHEVETSAHAQVLPPLATAQTAEPVVTASNGPDSQQPEAGSPVLPDKKLPAWFIQNIDYIASVNRDYKCSSARDLFNKLESLGTSDNKVVQKGQGRDRGKLYFVNSCTAIKQLTLGKFLPEIRAHVLC